MASIAAITILVALVGTVLYVIALYNSLIRLKNDTDRAWANIDVLLKQRHDELPKLLDTCKGYMQFEQKTLQAVIQARSALQSAGTVAEKAQADGQLSGALKSLFAVAEAYPDLKSNNSFLQLQSRITELEEKIADRREYFNDDVNTLNTRIQQFPDVLIANQMKLSNRELFKASEEERKDVQMAFM
jgi:LemA protein